MHLNAAIIDWDQIEMYNPAIGRKKLGISGNGVVNFSAGTTSNNLSAVTFSNANGVTFGLNGSVITGSVAPMMAASINVSAGSTSSNVSALTFSNGSGVTFGFDGSNVTATVATNYQSQGAYLTTAMASDRGSDFVQATAGFFGTNASGTIASNAISVSVAPQSAAQIKFSAGTLSALRSDITFADQPGASFGLDAAGKVTLSAYIGVEVTMGGSTLSGTRFDFYDTNGVSWALDPVFSAISASVRTDYQSSGNYLTTAMKSDAVTLSNINVSAGTTSNNLSAITFSNSNGLSFGLNASTITASYTVPSVTNSSWTVSDAATSATVGRLAFTNSNGLTLSLSTSNNGNHTVIGSYTVPTVTNSSLSLSDAATSMTIARLAFTNSNGLTLTLSTTTGGSATLVGSYTVPSTAGLLSNIKVSAGTLSQNRSDVTFSDSNGVSWGLNTNGVITASVAGGAGAGTGFTTITNTGDKIAGTLSTNGLQLAVPAYLTTAMASNAATISNIKISAGTLSQNRSDITFSDSNGISWGLNTNGVITGTVQTNYLTTARASTDAIGLNTSVATTAGTDLAMTGNSSGLTIGYPAWITTAAVSSAPAEYFCNLQEFQGVTTTMVQSNSFYLCPISISHHMTASYLRLLGSFNFTSTSIATSAVNNVTGASTAFSETIAFNAVLYSLGNGGNSRSLQYYFSGSAGLTWAASVSQASTTNATNQSITQKITFPNEGFTTANVTTQYSVSATNGPISTTQWSNLSANRYLDIPFLTSMSAGNYWLAFNRISGTVGGKNMDCNATVYGVSNSNISFGNLNSATNLSNVAPYIGLGLWTTNVAQTSSSVGLGSISATTSYMMPMVQFIFQS